MDPFEEFKRMRKQMDSMFESFWKEKAVALIPKVHPPAVDIAVKGKKIEIKADLPGISKKDINVVLDEDRIEIKAARKKVKKEKKKNYFRQERSFSTFYKSFTLPARVDPDKAKCDYKDGVLVVTAPVVGKLPQKGRRLLPK